MPDIFISYSRKDSAQAEQLAELLSSAGLSCWIDKAGIDLATSWSKEIVQAIDQCKAFVVLLSTSSNESTNVHKEVSLASEQKKKILPLDLEPVALSEELRYHLAGIQRAPMTNIDAVIRALAKLGLEATGAPQPPKIVKETDGRKSLMILPFEDLSPTADNAWFADGLATELISALSNVKALRVTDQQTTKEFKNFKGHLTTYAKEMSIRFFIQGSVRKFGDQIKITSALLDIETGDHLWQDSMKGTMNDIFDIQEKVAGKVVEGLKVHLASDEKKKLAERGTENAEAFELLLKAREYFSRQTKEGFQLAVQLLTEAIKLDPEYARAYQLKALAVVALYRSYDRTPAFLDEAETLCKEALRLKPDLFAVYYPLSMIYMHRGQLAEAEEAVREYIRKDPQNSNSHFALGFFYNGTGQPAKAIAPYEEAVRLNADSLAILWNLVENCYDAGEREKCCHWATVALPIFERHFKLHPDDEKVRMAHAVLLFHSGRTEDAHAAAMQLTNLKDGGSLSNMAGLFGKLGDKTEALRTFRKAIEAGYRNIRELKEFLTDEKEGIVSLAGTPEYEEVKQMVEKMSEPG
ncbi:MAG TPA: TIR domain-containing protein [Candidatus Kapabacteria bacterium]|nr:TIR domain-containing protein [Candidatus Kapabacteria bacterium]